jgi:hypothetical protein
MDTSFLMNLTVNLQTVSTFTQGFGIPAVIGEAERLPSADILVLTFAGDIITGNTINAKVNGAAITPVLFDTDNDTTIANLATILAATEEILTAVVTNNTTHDHVITCTARPFTPLTITNVAVTGGATQTTCAVTRTATAERIAFYATLAEMVTDGYLTTDPEYVAATRFFEHVELIAVINKLHTVETWVEALNSTLLQSNGGNWFRLVATTRDAQDIEDIMTWAPPNYKVFYASDDDAAILTSATDDLASTLQDLLLNGVLIYSDWSDGVAGHDQYPEAALAGVMSAANPGSIQADCKQLTGVTAANQDGTNLNTTQVTYALAKNCNVYVPMGGTYVTLEGRCCSGQFIDIIEGSYCLAIKLQEAWFNYKVNNAKVQFTDRGLAKIEDCFRQVCKLMQGADYGFLESYTITTPKVADISSADKGNRLASGFIINGIMTNGVIKVGLTVNLTF